MIVHPNRKWGEHGLLGLVIVLGDFTKVDSQSVRVLVSFKKMFYFVLCLYLWVLHRTYIANFRIKSLIFNFFFFFYVLALSMNLSKNKHLISLNTNYKNKTTNVKRVHPNSPAEKATLEPETDYMLGTPIEPFTDIERFQAILKEYIDQILPIYVYSSARV